MTRMFKLVISILVIVGIVAIAPANPIVVKTDQEVCLVNPGCDGEQVASAEIKKKKKKKGLKKEKGKKKKVKFFSKLFGSK